MVINFLGSRTFTSPTNMTGAGKWRTSRYSLFVFTQRRTESGTTLLRGATVIGNLPGCTTAFVMDRPSSI